MALTESFMDGVEPDKLLEGLEEAAQHYRDAVAEHGIDEAASPNPDPDWRRSFSEANGDVFVPDALTLTEDEVVIMGTDLWKKTQKIGYVERQYVFDNAVGQGVAQSLWYAVNSERARRILPDHTVALFEVNANRGFTRGHEDNAGCHGLPQNWLGYIGVDTYYRGPADLNTRQGGETPIDYLGEPGGWTTSRLGASLERNAARIRIRPAHPIITTEAMPLMWRDGDGPRGELVARQRLVAGEELGDDEQPTFRNYAWLSGEYRIIRAVAILDDPDQWEPNDFLDKEALVKRRLLHEA